MTYCKQNSLTIIDKLILFVLLLTPIFSFQESLALIMLEQRGSVHTSNILSPIYLKVVKDSYFIFYTITSILLP